MCVCVYAVFELGFLSSGCFFCANLESRSWMVDADRGGEHGPERFFSVRVCRFVCDGKNGVMRSRVVVGGVRLRLGLCVGCLANPFGESIEITRRVRRNVWRSSTDSFAFLHRIEILTRVHGWRRFVVSFASRRRFVKHRSAIIRPIIVTRLFCRSP